MRMARGDVFAFIDSDAYPRPDWLRNAVRRLAEADAVGGPALTPPSDSFAQRAGGCVLSSPLMGGLSARFRGSPRVAEVDLILIETKTPVVKRRWRIIEELKEELPGVRVALAGDHVTALPLESFRNSPVDYVLTGGTTTSCSSTWRITWRGGPGSWSPPAVASVPHATSSSSGARGTTWRSSRRSSCSASSRTCTR